MRVSSHWNGTAVRNSRPADTVVSWPFLSVLMLGAMPKMLFGRLDDPYLQ
ncbi:hypothetical protein SAMN06269185_2005 [Natronoarchaeum philippinense]|uniref:Uncharacterized protein n=1 Tax=Natronoarchaeum philippinense TaxID=558529 RepID=A0A285NUS4_NATPI|nr:hypothetical protein SAMN06269185_2005 [Natronoarchaeum philippinense]